MFAGEGTPGAHQPPLPLPRASASRPRACRPPSTRPRCTARTRTCGPTSTASIGNSGVVDRHARRHEEAVFRLRPVRADHLGVDDDQRPGADDPRDVHEHRDRPAGREVPARRPARWDAAHDKIEELFDGRERPELPRRCCRTANDGLGPRACSASPATRSSTRETYAAHQAPRRCQPCAAPCRPTSSRKTRRRTPASSPPSSRCG